MHELLACGGQHLARSQCSVNEIALSDHTLSLFHHRNQVGLYQFPVKARHSENAAYHASMGEAGLHHIPAVTPLRLPVFLHQSRSKVIVDQGIDAHKLLQLLALIFDSTLSIFSISAFVVIISDKVFYEPFSN